MVAGLDMVPSMCEHKEALGYCSVVGACHIWLIDNKWRGGNCGQREGISITSRPLQLSHCMPMIESIYNQFDTLTIYLCLCGVSYQVRRCCGNVGRSSPRDIVENGNLIAWHRRLWKVLVHAFLLTLRNDCMSTWDRGWVGYVFSLHKAFSVVGGSLPDDERIGREQSCGFHLYFTIVFISLSAVFPVIV